MSLAKKVVLVPPADDNYSNFQTGCGEISQRENVVLKYQSLTSLNQNCMTKCRNFS